MTLAPRCAGGAIYRSHPGVTVRIEADVSAGRPLSVLAAVATIVLNARSVVGDRGLHCDV